MTPETLQAEYASDVDKLLTAQHVTFYCWLDEDKAARVDPDAFNK